MSATNANDLSTSTAVLYVAKINTTATIAKPTTSGSNADTVLTNIKTAYPTLSWVRLASVKDAQIAEEPTANLQEVIVDDGNGLIYSTVKPNEKFTATWLESKNAKAREILLGVAPVTLTESTVDYSVTAIEKATRVAPRFAVMILATRADGKVEEYYMTDAKITGEVIIQFLKSAGEPTGSQITLELNDGGISVKKIPKTV
jgi:hypothetical protein